MCACLESVPVVRWLGLFVSLSLAASNADAGQPELAFDFGRTIDCRDVTAEIADPGACDDASGKSCDPGQKVVELKLRVSVHLLAGQIADVEEVRIELSDCDSRIRVDSYSPNTRLQSDFSKDIVVTKTSENGKSLSASLGGEAPVPLGNLVAHVLPSVNGGFTKREVLTEKKTRHAPRYAVVASGTIARAHGVFFKLRSSPQTTLEGSHELTVRFIVPKNWRGDSLRVCCTATGHEKFLWTQQEATWSRICAPLAIYLSGDTEARLAAEAHVAQRSL